MAAACCSRTRTSVFKLHNGTKSIRQDLLGLISCKFMCEVEQLESPLSVAVKSSSGIQSENSTVSGKAGISSRSDLSSTHCSRHFLFRSKDNDNVTDASNKNGRRFYTTSSIDADYRMILLRHNFSSSPLLNSNASRSSRSSCRAPGSSSAISVMCSRNICVGFHSCVTLPNLTCKTESLPCFVGMHLTTLNPCIVCVSRTYSTKRSASHYYDILGLAPKATQKQIKSAYYKMSKVYHPDVAKDKKSHIKFTEINEAYEVLGNIQKRRLYDRGLLHERDPRAPYNPEDASFHGGQTRRSPFERGERPPPPRGRSRIYNFDEFYRQHYNDVRERRSREWNEFVKQRNMENTTENRHNTSRQGVSGPLLISLWILIGFIFIGLSENQGHVMSKEYHQRRDAYSVNNSPQAPMSPMEQSKK